MLPTRRGALGQQAVQGALITALNDKEPVDPVNCLAVQLPVMSLDN